MSLILILSLLAADDPSGHWEGKIEIPQHPVVVLLDLVAAPSWSGKLGVPEQGVNDLPLTRVSVSDGDIVLGADALPGQPIFKGKYAAGEIKGEYTQSGATFPFTLGRQRIWQPKVRPQDPRPPLPYKADEVTYQNGAIK